MTQQSYMRLAWVLVHLRNTTVNLANMPTDEILTRREAEILEFIAAGRTSKQIADKLNLSVYTVNNHRKHICKKFALHSTAQLVAFAIIESSRHGNSRERFETAP
jgi:DNA-binding CsgD family transcriptional regulator